MAKKSKKLQRRIWIVVNTIVIIGMLLFTLAPLLRY